MADQFETQAQDIPAMNGNETFPSGIDQYSKELELGTPELPESEAAMRREYVQPEDKESPRSPNRNYKMASDIFGTGMDRSWTASPASHTPSSKHSSSPLPGLGNSTKHIPRSFKITEPAANSTPDDTGNADGRKARESNGNPLTGQGFDGESKKTGKRYFEGSNANQKLW